MITRFYNELLDEEMYKKVLDNGFGIYVLPKKDYTKKHAYFATEYGSLYNKFEENGNVVEMPLGIAHFLEHKIFEDEEGSIFETFAKLGASVNAYTNYFSTCYTFSTVDNYKESLTTLIDFVQRPHITDENVEKEKDIIVQELKMYDDQPNWRAYINLLESMYFNHPIRYDIGGTIDSVNLITKEELLKCYNSFYSPDRMLAFVIGDIDVDETFETVENALTEEFLNKPHSPKLILPDEPDEVKRKYFEEKMDVTVPIVYMGIKDKVFYDNPKKRLEKGLISKMLADMVFGRGSDFYEKHYESGLINASFSSDFSYGRTFGYTAITSETKTPEELLKAIENEINKIKEIGLSKDVFERIRKKMIGRYLSSFNSTQYIANSFMNYYMRGIELFDYLETLQSITFDMVGSRFEEHFDLNYSSVSIVK